jgi:predicted MPP superfamily phosphohydrolase
MNKKKLVGFLFSIVLILSSIFYFGFFDCNSNIKLLKTSISTELLNEKIPNFKVVIFSDLKFNGNEKKIDEAIILINNQNPDLVIFAGDIFTESNIYTITEEYKNTIITKLDSINSKYGKFAVLGDIDEIKSDTCKNILLSADFEILENVSTKISNSSSEYFNLVGLKPTINNDYDISSIYQNISKDKFTLTICHTPDIYSDIISNTNILVSGHTLGGERIFPLLGPVGSKTGFDKYYEGIHKVDDSEIIISNGIGSNSDYRIFAPANIIVLTIKNK